MMAVAEHPASSGNRKYFNAKATNNKDRPTASY